MAEEVSYNVEVLVKLRMDMPEILQEDRNELVNYTQKTLERDLTVLDYRGARGGVAIDDIEIQEVWA